MSLLQEWRQQAYSQKKNQKLWDKYFEIEKRIYKQMLTIPITRMEGTVRELSEIYNVDIMIFTGFLDGINDSLKEPNPIDIMEESTRVCIDIDLEKLYYNMVQAKADWLYGLSEWDLLMPEDRRKELYWKQKKSNTILKGEKIGRNDPCPCNSGKKYKKCCGM